MDFIQKLAILLMILMCIPQSPYAASIFDEKPLKPIEVDDVGDQFAPGDSTYTLENILYRFAPGDSTYTLGRNSGGMQHGIFVLCRGVGKVSKWIDESEEKNKKDSDPTRKLEWPEGQCTDREYWGDCGNWLNSPDARYFYLQDMDYMDGKSFYLVDVRHLKWIERLKVPKGERDEDGSVMFGPDPSLGEVTFDNTSSVLAVLTGRNKLWIYDRVRDTSWTLRRPISGFTQIDAVQLVDKNQILLWSSTNEVSLLNIDETATRWIVKLPDSKKKEEEETSGRFVIVSPNLNYAALVNERGAWLLDVRSGKLLNSVAATAAWTPSIECASRAEPEQVEHILPRGAGRCGQTIVTDHGSANIRGVDGVMRELVARP